MFQLILKIRNSILIRRNLAGAAALKQEAWTWQGSTLFAGPRDEWLRTAPVESIALVIGQERR